ncbi:MAG: helix-turn-helix transcriptional regulator [Mesorhizobium sp.]
MSNNWTITNAALEKLPLFATDLELAIAIVGKQNASRWKREVLPALEHRGFPKFDALHGGRPVIKVAKFYESYIGATGPGINGAPDSKDNVGTWEERQAEKKAKARANSDAWAEKKRKALEDFRAQKAAEVTRSGATRILTRKEAAEMCKLTPAGFDVWVRKGIIPPATPGTRRWDQRAIDAALDRLSGLGGDKERGEESYTNWKRDSERGTKLSPSPSKVGKGGYPIPTGPNDPLKQEYEELGFDPVTMGEKEMMELLKAADERWKASIPDTKLGKREIGALLQLAKFGMGVAVGTQQIKSCGIDTEARLEARGFIRILDRDGIEKYELTQTGFEAAKQVNQN